MFDKLDDLILRYEEVMRLLSEPDVANDSNRFRSLMKEQSDLAPIVEAYKKYKEAKKAAKEQKAAEKENARKEGNDRAWALSRGIKNLGNGFGITKKSIEKRSAKRLEDANKLAKAEHDAKMDEIYKN